MFCGPEAEDSDDDDGLRGEWAEAEGGVPREPAGVSVKGRGQWPRSCTSLLKMTRCDELHRLMNPLCRSCPAHLVNVKVSLLFCMLLTGCSGEGPPAQQHRC